MGKVLDGAADNVVVTRDAVDLMIDYEPMQQMFYGFEEHHMVRLIQSLFLAIELALG